MYVYHKDIPNNQWNVFKKEGEQEIYVCSFPTAEKAASFCSLMNNDIALRAQIATAMGGE